MKLTFRAARAEDAASAASLIDAAYRKQVRRLYGDSRRGRWRGFPRDRMSQYIRRDREGVRLGFHRHRLLTVAVCRGYGHFGWLHTLAVHLDYQRQGLGRQMMTDAESHLAQRGVRAIALMTWPDAVDNIGFYQRFGYRVYGFSLYAYRRVHQPLARGDSPLRLQRLSQPDSHSSTRPASRDELDPAILALCHAIMPGLDYRAWIWWMVESGNGEALLFWREHDLIALALVQPAASAAWLEGKLLLISPAADQSETIWILELIRRRGLQLGGQSFGFPLDVAHGETALSDRGVGRRHAHDASSPSFEPSCLQSCCECGVPAARIRNRQHRRCGLQPHDLRVQNHFRKIVGAASLPHDPRVQNHFGKTVGAACSRTIFGMQNKTISGNRDRAAASRTYISSSVRYKAVSGNRNRAARMPHQPVAFD